MDGGEVAGGASPSSAESSFRELDDVFLQTQTRIWLGEVLLTRLDEHLNISDLLADGELLFEVSKVVWKMLLTNCMEIKHLKAYKAVSSRKSSGRYRPYSNVDSFLKISKILGLTGIDLFSPSDVVEKRNTRRVLAMPTNMVGCIRRSLELSQCSFSSSDSYNQYKDPKMTCRKKNSVAAGARNYDTYSQESDIESNYTGFQSHSPSMNCASDSALLINLDLENSPEVSSVVKSYTSVQNEFQLEIQDQEKDEYTQCQCESRCLDEPVGSLCSHCVKKDHLADSISFPSWVDSEIKLRTRSSLHINRGVRHDRQIDMLDLIQIDLYLGNGASTVGDSTDGSSLEKGHASNDLAIPDLIDHGTDDGGHVLFDGDDDILKLEMSSDSCGSNSPGQTSVNGFGRIHSDNLEDAEEVSSMASLGSVTGRVRHLDFEDQLDEEDDLRTVKVLFPELQSQKDDLVNRSCLIGVRKSQDMLRHEKIIHSSTLGYPDQIRDLSDNGKMTIGGTMTESDPGIKEHSNELLQAAYFDRVCEDSNASSDIIASQDGEKWNKLSHTDCSVGFKHCQCPHILDMIEVDNHVQPYESTLEKYLCLTSGSSQNVGKTGQEVCTDPKNCIPCAENMGKASGQDERKHEKMDVSAAEISDRKEDISTGIPHHKPQKRPRLKSLVIGTAVFGAVLVLLHLRRRSSRDETGEPSIRPRQTQKVKCMELSSQKRQKGGNVDGVYPAEKLRFSE
ncbi:uncharacterized protein LOC117918731 isoform X2 [Vitis riparia]|uniref:uncharacterized protein LOC117918731 isoform X2 n=1 Tax=Vitis riparia TaxID=96939 RepID=UPI00155A9B2D|nr:uncharacterized protein LOC117918731 isoform X2 [Vitis riparia]